MVTIEKAYGCKCDRCGKYHTNATGVITFPNEIEIVNDAVDHEWAKKDGGHYCRECHYIDPETDEVVIRELYPDSVRKVRQFIEKVKNRDVFLVEDDTSFLLRFSLNEWGEHDTAWVMTMCDYKVKIRYSSSGPDMIKGELQEIRIEK